MEEKDKLFEVKMIYPKGSKLHEVLEQKPLKIKVNIEDLNEVKDIQIDIKDKKPENLNEIKIHKDPTVNGMLMDWVNENKKK
jgi:hypothetical protein|nr:MAG TPA: hypothetical protein [Caudoviricetes sp.]